MRFPGRRWSPSRDGGDFVRHPTCKAPAVALQFSFYGRVQACCQNGKYVLGDVRQHTLQQIWDGLPRRLMAESLERGDYPHGCDLCEHQHRVGQRMATPAESFDRFATPTDWPRQMEFSLSNRCNLACVHCNGDNSSTIRKVREGRPPMEMPYGDAFFEQVRPFLPHLELAAFLGGEPFLAPEARRIWDMLLELPEDQRPEVHVTTNATVWNDRVEAYVEGLRMHFAVSIDGATAATYDAIREGADYERVVEVRDRMLAAARRHGTWFQLNFCLLRSNWHELGLFLLQADELDVPANIIQVFQPADHSLFTLPADELATIDAELTREGRRLRRRLGRNRDVWDATLASVRSHAEGGAHLEIPVDDDADPADHPVLASPQPVELRPRVPASDLSVDDVRAELEEWSGRPCVELHFPDGTISRVQAPEWAAALATPDWTGLRLEDLTGLVAAVLGPVLDSSATERSPGVLQIDTVMGSADDPVRFRSVLFESTGLVLATTPDPVPGPAPATPLQ